MKQPIELSRMTVGTIYRSTGGRRLMLVRKAPGIAHVIDEESDASEQVPDTSMGTPLLVPDVAFFLDVPSVRPS